MANDSRLVDMLREVYGFLLRPQDDKATRIMLARILDVLETCDDKRK